MRKIKINNIEYPSIKEASEDNNINFKKLNDFIYNMDRKGIRKNDMKLKLTIEV